MSAVLTPKTLLKRNYYKVNFLSDFLMGFLSQLQSPTLGFLIGGMVVAAVGSRLSIPDPVYKFIVFMLLIIVLIISFFYFSADDSAVWQASTLN